MEARKYEGGDIYINPRDKLINPNAIGNFLCKNYIEECFIFHLFQMEVDIII